MRIIKKLYPSCVTAVTMKVAAVRDVALSCLGTGRSVPTFRINLLYIFVVQDCSTFISGHILEEFSYIQAFNASSMWQKEKVH
jgi:hypothetical protein